MITEVKPAPTHRRVAVTATSFIRSTELMQALHTIADEVIAAPTDLAGDALAQFLADSAARVAIVGKEPVTASVLAQCPNLRFIAKYGVGLDNLDLEAMHAKGVGLGWTPGVNRRAVAELVIAFTLGHLRHITASIIRMRQGQWVKDGGRSLTDLMVGIVGFGNIGTELATMLQPFGCRLCFHDIVDRRADGQRLNATAVDYDTLLAQADVISFHVPGGPETRGLFGAREIALCKPSALVINTARGQVVDFQATCNAVLEGHLGGFAADVYENEPYDASPWHDCPALYFTPHIAGNSRQAVSAMGKSALAHVADYFGLQEDAARFRSGFD